MRGRAALVRLDVFSLVSDDELVPILKTLADEDSAALLPFVLACRRVRKIQRAEQLFLVTQLGQVCSSLRLLRWAIDEANLPPRLYRNSDTLISHAASHGAIDVMQHALDTLDAVWVAEVPSWVTEGSKRPTPMRSAAREGHIEFIEAALALGCPWGAYPMLHAIAEGRLTVLRRMHELGCPIGDDVAYEAGVVGNLDILRWLHGVGADMSGACAGAIHNLELLQEARALGGELDTSMLSAAVSAAKLDMVKWALEEGCTFPPGEAEKLRFLWYGIMVEFGDWDLVQLCHERGLPFHEWAAVAAVDAWSDGLLVLARVQWLHSAGCPIGGRTMYQAILSGNLELVQWIDALGVVEWASFAINDFNDSYPGDNDRQWRVSGCGDVSCRCAHARITAPPVTVCASARTCPHRRPYILETSRCSSGFLTWRRTATRDPAP